MRLRSEASRLAARAEREGLLRRLDHVEPPGSYAGVDGWLARVYTVYSQAVYYTRAVAVYMLDGSEDLGVLEDLILLPVEGGYEDCDEAAEYTMMTMEARLVLESSGRVPLVMVDGPLVDPPREPRSQLARRLHSNYHPSRAGLLREASRRALVVGYVKKPRGERLLAPLLEWRGYDLEVATVVLQTVAGEEVVMLGPIELAGGVYDAYRLYGLRLCTAYTITPWWQYARRVEAECGRIEEAVALVHALTPRGAKHPVPVQLAHQEANRGREALGTLRSMLAGRLTSHTGPLALWS